MYTYRTSRGALCLLVSNLLLTLLVMSALPGGLAWAQAGAPGANIELQAFRPAMDSRGLITLDGSQVLGHKQLSFGLVTHWGRNLLAFESDEASYRVQHMLTPTLVGALGVRLGSVGLEFGVSLPFAVMSGDRDPDFQGVPGDPNDDQRHGFEGQGMGDIGIHGKIRLARDGRGPRVGLALVASLQLPTASTERSWMGSNGLTPELMAVVDKRVGRLSLALNGGVRVRPGGVTRFDDVMFVDASGVAMPTTQQSIAVGTSMPVGAGLSYALAPGRFEIVAEVIGELPLGASENFVPVEAIGGVKLYLAESSYLTLGGGAGILAGPGNPDVRAFMGIVFEPRVGDRDNDGVPDDMDRCPYEAEDRDGFADQDGCADLDNDNDGILDEDDECPDEAEDLDGWQDGDGCPDPDNDGDRILDEDDQCPTEPEVYNTVADDDGCPDRGPVELGEDRLVVMEKIHFEYDSAVIERRSHRILEVVAGTLQLNPEIGLIEVQGHTDARGPDDYNLRLSQARAESVVDFLVAHGVAATRLRARGYGERVPLDKGDNADAWAANRRVEFVVMPGEAP